MKTPCPSRVPREPTVHRHVDDHAVDGRSTRVWGPQARNVVFPPRNRHAGTEPSTPRRRMTSKLRMAGRIVIVALGSLLAFCSGAWGALALWYRLPGGRAARVLGSAAWVALLLALATLAIDRHGWLPLGAYAAAYAMLLLWWVGIAPSGQRDWRDDVARLLTGTMQGDHVRLDNVRNFDWRSDTDYDIRWESRSYDLARLVGADAVVSHWGSRAIAHAMLSFGFDDGRHLAFSVEVRKSRDQEYSSIGGFYKQVEIVLIAADEHDIIRVRTNIRGEAVSLGPDARGCRKSDAALDALPARPVLDSPLSAASRG